MNQDKKPLTKGEKIKITIFIGLLVVSLGMAMSSYDTKEVALDYKTPPFSQLQVSTGIISFTPQPRNNSNELILTIYKNGKLHMKLQFVCDQPGLQNIAQCNTAITDKGVVNFKNRVHGKEGTVWWTNIPATGERRLYQLESGGVKFITYEDQSKFYQNYVEKQIAKEKRFNDIRKD